MVRKAPAAKFSVWPVLLITLLLVFLAAYLSQQSYIRRQQDTIAQLKAERLRVAEENIILQRKIDFTYTDEYIEREARSKLGLVKDGEILYESND